MSILTIKIILKVTKLKNIKRGLKIGRLFVKVCYTNNVEKYKKVVKKV